MSEHTAPTRDDVRGYLRERRNWGRWGADDQRGAINLIGADHRGSNDRYWSHEDGRKRCRWRTIFVDRLADVAGVLLVIVAGLAGVLGGAFWRTGWYDRTNEALGTRWDRERYWLGYKVTHLIGPWILLVWGLGMILTGLGMAFTR